MSNLKRYIVFILIASVMLFVLSGCDEDPLFMPGLNADLRIESVDFPDTVWIGTAYEFTARVKLEGTANTETENYTVKGTVGFDQIPDFIRTAQMLDNGISPDIIPGDFEFASLVSTEIFGGNTGPARITFTAERSVSSGTEAVNISSENSDSYEKTITVLGTNRNSAPAISNFMGITDTVLIDDEDYTIISADVSDPDGTGDIASVTAMLYFPYQASPDLIFELKDDGEGHDAAAGDGRFTGTIIHEKMRIFGGGIYTLLIFAHDSYGNKSPDLIEEFTAVADLIDYEPEIVQILIPDSIRADGNPVLLQVEVADSNGLSDIKRVYYIFSASSSGTPIDMYDDGGTVPRQGGTSGDLVKGDGIYSLTVQFPPGSPPGDYFFTFYVIDKALNIVFREESFVLY